MHFCLKEKWDSHLGCYLNLTLSDPGGGGLRGQTHSCQSETSYPMMPKLGDFQFCIFKTPFGQILAKLVNQRGCYSSFLFETSQKLENEKVFLCLKIAKIDIGGRGQFWVEKNDTGHKSPFFKR